MMGRLYPGPPGSMMGGTSYGWMMGGAGYRWMIGGPAAPAWMRGRALPGFMMGTSRDPGKIMGSLFADDPGPWASPAAAARLGSQLPVGAAVSRGPVTGSPSPAPAPASPSSPAPPEAPI